MLYDVSRASNLTPLWFDPGFWHARNEVSGEARGRGKTLFIEAANRHFVLRHYRRGGLMARVSEDQYLWSGEYNTRPFDEWHLTYHLRRAGLPVAAPVAARYQRQGRHYTGDLLTERLLDTKSLAQSLHEGSLALDRWVAIGRCIGQFHDFGVEHADLNAHNILLRESGNQVFLIDFDRGRLRRRGLWCDVTIVRLRRSLEKIAMQLPRARFTEADWHALLSGYRERAIAIAPAATG
ncbi:MAG: 3-deoxy-D-manno-octulosonic acid kinase [Steroidobacteraceae bacterium]